MQKNTNLKTYSLKEVEHYKVHGRTEDDMYPLPLFFNGSGIEVNVTGSELWIDLEVDCDVHEPWIWTAINGAFMSRERAEQKQQQLLQKQQDLQDLEAKLTNDIMLENQQLNMQLADTLNSFLREFNADGRYHMIFANTGKDNILQAADSYDITAEVIEALNARYASKKK